MKRLSTLYALSVISIVPVIPIKPAVAQNSGKTVTSKIQLSEAIKQLHILINSNATDDEKQESLTNIAEALHNGGSCSAEAFDVLFNEDLVTAELAIVAYKQMNPAQRRFVFLKAADFIDISAIKLQKVNSMLDYGTVCLDAEQAKSFADAISTTCQFYNILLKEQSSDTLYAYIDSGNNAVQTLSLALQFSGLPCGQELNRLIKPLINNAGLLKPWSEDESVINYLKIWALDNNNLKKLRIGLLAQSQNLDSAVKTLSQNIEDQQRQQSMRANGWQEAKWHSVNSGYSPSL